MSEDKKPREFFIQEVKTGGPYIAWIAPWSNNDIHVIEISALGAKEKELAKLNIELSKKDKEITELKQERDDYREAIEKSKTILSNANENNALLIFGSTEQCLNEALNKYKKEK